jgi:hypothetical protein
LVNARAFDGYPLALLNTFQLLYRQQLSGLSFSIERWRVAGMQSSDARRQNGCLKSYRFGRLGTTFEVEKGWAWSTDSLKQSALAPFSSKALAPSTSSHGQDV